MNAGAGAVAADLLGRRRTAQALTVATAVLGTYLGSYTGVLLASTAVPVWSRSRRFLPPIFMCTASASGAAATRLALAATGASARDAARPRRHETVAMTGELVLSAVNERRLGIAGRALEEQPRALRAARWLTVAGLARRVVAPRSHVPSVAVPRRRAGLPVRLGRRGRRLGARPRGGRGRRPEQLALVREGVVLVGDHPAVTVARVGRA